MAHAIDTRHLVEQWMPRLNDLLSSAKYERNRYQVHRVSVCATVISHDEATIELISISTPSFSVTQAALNCQPDPDVDQSDLEVLYNLTQMGDAPQWMPKDDNSCPKAPLCTSAISPAWGERQPPAASSFHRHSFRLSSLEIYHAAPDVPGYHVGATALQELVTTVGKVPSEWWQSWLLDEGPEIVWTRNLPSAVLMHVQVDILDLHCTRRLTPTGRRRRRYGTFQQVSPGGGEQTLSSQEDPISAAKRYNGVRYRTERKRYVAENRPPGYKNKVSFGDFKSPAEAARAADAAFHYLGPRDKLNFATTPDILATKSIPIGLDQEDTLRFVKEQAKWLASLPSMATTASTGWAENTLDQPFVNGGATDYAVGVIMNELSELIGQTPRSSEENAIVASDPSDPIWDGFKSPGVEQACDQFQSVVMDLILGSPPAPNSLFRIEGEVADGLLHYQFCLEDGYCASNEQC